MYAPARLESLPEDPTIDEVRAYLPRYIAEEAVFDGWGDTARDNAAQAHGIDAALAQLAFANGPMDMIDAWISDVDATMIAAWPQKRLESLKIRDRVTQLIKFRFETVTANREALRRAVAIMALPGNIRQTTKISWRTADLVWRLAGDEATDYSHYTKRLIVSGVYASTLMVFLDDESQDFAETWAFLDRRIENVMQFEKAKARITGREDDRFSLSRFLGRLRYPAG